MTLAPGPRGVAHVRGFLSDPGGTLVGLRRRYGDIVHVRRGPLRGCFVFHPEHVRYVLENTANYRRGSWFPAKLHATLGRGIASLENEEALAHRRLVEPLVDDDRLARLGALVGRTAPPRLDAWVDGRRAADTIDVRRQLEHLSAAHAGPTVFGPDWDVHAEFLMHTRTMFVEEASREFASPLGLIPLSVPLPFHRAFLRTRSAYLDLVDAMIERRGTEDTGDLLSALVRVRTEEGRPLSKEQVRDDATTLFMLWEPIAIVLTRVCHLLAQHPEVADEMRAEADAVIGARQATAEDIPALRRTREVVDEVLRLYPPVFFASREAAAGDEIGGYAIPAGTRVQICSYVTHRHEAFWQDPERFDPDRFRHGRPSQPFVWLPFARPAPRGCFGYDLAQIELPLIAALLVQRYRLHLVPGERVRTTMTLAHDYPDGLRLRVERV